MRHMFPPALSRDCSSEKVGEGPGVREAGFELTESGVEGWAWEVSAAAQPQLLAGSQAQLGLPKPVALMAWGL